MSEIKRPRRYYLHKRLQAALYEESDIELTWQAKQESEPGTPLPTSFPHRAALAAFGYTTSEDLDGADADELLRVGFSTDDAKAIIEAL
jgi:hypothetical protein